MSEISKATYRSNLRSTASKRMQQDQIIKHSGSSRWSWCQRTIGNIRNIHHKCSTHKVFGAAAARWGTLGFGTKTKIQRRRKRKRMPLMKYRYVFSGRSGLTSNFVVMVALPSNRMDSISGTKVGDTPLMILICKLSNAFTWCAVPYTTVYITLPWGGGSSATARRPRGCQYQTMRLRKALGDMIPNAVLFGADTIPTVEIYRLVPGRTWPCAHT